MVNNSTAFGLEMTIGDEDPSKKVCVLLIIVFLPLLLFGLKWFSGPQAFKK